MGRIVIITGPPGAGKSTVARALAEGSPVDRAVHLHTDDFFAYIRKGFVEPWRPESQAQNATIMEALVATAARFAADGYEVLADGIVGPWFLAPWVAGARAAGLDLRYVVLLPTEAETLSRGTARTAPGAMTDPAVIGQMWTAFATADIAAANRRDTSGESAIQTLAAIRAGLAAGGFTL